MITILKTYSSYYYNENHLEHCTSYEMYGRSTDEKPTNVGNASTFYEMDTKKVFLFDEEKKTWIEQ